MKNWETALVHVSIITSKENLVEEQDFIEKKVEYLW